MKNLFRIFLFGVLLVDIMCIGFFGMLFYAASRPLDSIGADKTIIIERGMNVSDIAARLEDEGIISDRVAFVLYAMTAQKEGRLQAGTYTLSSRLSIREIIEFLSGGKLGRFVRITIPEGFTSEAVAQRLVHERVLSNEEDFLKLVHLSSKSARQLFEEPFLDEMTAAPSLEGFLFPDTYEFRRGSTPEEVLGTFFDNFQRRTKDLRPQTKNFYDTLIVASLLEKELQTEEDMKRAASVLYNRLAAGMPLQVDATIAYITGKKTGELTSADKAIDHPFNTYQHKGLPPAPISNPGLKAINAALKPTPSDYLYYLTAPDGTTYFAKTLKEHNENKVKYLH